MCNQVRPLLSMCFVSNNVLFRNLWLLAPLFMAAFWHEVVLFNFFNTSLFNVRSRAVNAGFYFVARIIASFIIRYACDCSDNLRKRIAAAVGTLAFFLLIGFTVKITHEKTSPTHPQSLASLPFHFCCRCLLWYFVVLSEFYSQIALT